jgi:feruloyl esterase
VFTKDLIAAYYGRPARLAYFEGGSNGGREALMEARRFPEDYDGIIAGMPAMSFTRLMASFLWNYQAAAAAPGLKSKLGLVSGAVLDKCDALDGVTDRVLENPATCTFDPVALQCKGSGAVDCLTVEEVSALQKIHGGPRLKNGSQVFPGLPVGSETHPTEMNFWIFDEKALQPGMGQEAFRWMVHRDPDWDKNRFDVDRDYPAAAKLADILDSDDPDLTEFLKRGGKLIIHHGWNDAAIPAGSTLNYHDALLEKVGSAADQQVRLFMVPGMGHGPGRPGPEHYDMLGELDRWVEGGPAPERVITRQFEKPPTPFFPVDLSAKVVRTRPLCAWPKVAHYNGSGSTDDEANFDCK